MTEEDDDTLEACCDHCGSSEHPSEECPHKP
jgi:hypothetical protein